ncbi:unnamed protein product, partial [Cuscuta campestris]
WADRVIKPERVHPEPTKDLEDACEKLLKGDPVTGKPYAYGGWVFRLSNPDGVNLRPMTQKMTGQTSRMVMLRPVLLVQVDYPLLSFLISFSLFIYKARKITGHMLLCSFSDMNFNRMTTIIEDDDDDVQVLHSNRSPNRNPPSPPQNIGVEGASTARCSSFDDLIRDKQVKSPSALHFSEGDRVESKPKEASHSSSRAKGQKRKGSHKSSKGDRKKKVRLSDTEGESIEEAFLSLAKKLSKAGVISEEIGQSLLEPKDQ